MESLAAGTMKDGMPMQRPARTFLFSALCLISSLANVTAEDARLTCNEKPGSDTITVR